MAGLMCPSCGRATSPEVERFDATVVLNYGDGKYSHRSGVAEAVVPPRTDQLSYAVIVCQACGERLVAARLYDYGEWKAVYPIAHRTVANEIPEPMKSEFEEAHLCFAVGACRACAAVCEIALEAVWKDKKVSRLNDLRDAGVISPALFEQATEVRLWANVAKHELIQEAVDQEDAEQLLGYMEDILEAVYVQPARLAALSKKRKKLEKGG